MKNKDDGKQEQWKRKLPKGILTCEQKCPLEQCGPVYFNGINCINGKWGLLLKVTCGWSGMER